MTATETLSAPLGQASAPISHTYKVQPMRALKAFRRLVADKEDTFQVFEIMRALAGRSMPRGYARLLKTPEGGRQAGLADEFSHRLHDTPWLESLPAGSVGAGYRAFVAARDISAYGLADESRKLPDANFDAVHPVAWYARRLRDVHDVWHVLTGYGTDALGESCLVAFSLPHTRTPGFALIAAGAALEFEKAKSGHPYAKAIWQAWRHGRSAAWLAALDYQALFAQPLDAARAALNIERPTIYESIPAEARDGVGRG
ncbi:MAG: Coq4 family protein [Caulobacteraceae bacterium]